VLVRSVARAVKIPIIAAGGFADGQGLLAALALGAGAVAMGTRFAATQESALHDTMKQAIVEKGEDETLYSKDFDGMWARIMRTPRSLAATRRPMSFFEMATGSLRTARKMGMPLRPVLERIISNPGQTRLLAHFGASLPLVEAATIEGDLENGVQFIGQAQGLVGDIPTAAKLIERIIDEAESQLRSLTAND
jgi:enoyl-[acyl-carrier protein] reductase II